MPCYVECMTCNQTNLCLTCMYLNAIPDTNQGCVCNHGYYNTSTMVHRGYCIPCFNECATCNKSNTCLTCIALNSSPNNITNTGCLCNNGYYSTNALTLSTSCLKCFQECSSCNEANICLTCISLNSSPDSSQGCKCDTGYGGIAPLTSTDSCILCNSECSTCNQANICLNCNDPNASPNLISGCTCNPGYWGNLAMGKFDNLCNLCYWECSTCNDPILCLTCTDINASRNSVQGCDCNDGFYKHWLSSNNYSCIACENDCLTCNTSSICFTCKSLNSYALPTGGCKCYGGFYNISALTSLNSCIKCELNSNNTNCYCDNSCYDCIGTRYFDCFSCIYFYLDGMCFEKCPLGYISNQTDCILLNNNTIPTVKYTFTSVGNIFLDEINGIEAITVYPNKSRRLTPAIPISAYLRGVYFPGTGGHLIINETNHQIFGDLFSISLWINPIQYNGVLLYKGDSSTFLFDLSLNSPYICYTIYINTTLQTFCSTDSIILNEWNHIFLTLEYTQSTFLSITINGLTTSLFFVSLAPFKDNITVPLLIGTDSLSNISYYGFIYMIEIYAATPIINNLVSKNCKNCSVCTIDLNCIANCDIKLYFSVDTQACISCLNNCSDTCRNKFNCSMCLDSHCIACSSFLENSCTECISPYVVINSLCYPCGFGLYYDSISKSCIKCPPLCTSCISQSICTSCIGNSSLNNSYWCECSLGYSGNTSCSRNNFYVSMTIDQNNNITLTFSEPLQRDLSAIILNISISEQNLSYEVYKINPEIYILTIDFSVDATSTSILNITFPSNITSVYNSLLQTTFLTTYIFTNAIILQQQQKQIQTQAAAAKSLSTTGATVGASVTLGISLANFDLSSIFSFLNTAEMFYSVYLFNIDLYPVLSEFLIGMRIQSKLPNIYSNIFNENDGAPMSTKYVKFGYPTNLILLNIGVHLTMFTITISIFIIVILLALKPWFKTKLKPVLEIFKYGAFIRFWVQTYFEFSIASSVGLHYCSFNNLTQVFAFLICILIIVRKLFRQFR